MRDTPKGLRIHIGLFGRRNVGKSSLLNALVGQKVCVVSPVAGTTTDPVEKAMELQPLGPVLFVDTAGLDDDGGLGELRVERSRTVFDRADVGLVVTEAGRFGPYEETVVTELRRRDAFVIVVFNKSDRRRPAESETRALTSRGIACVETCAESGAGLEDLRAALTRAAPTGAATMPALLGDLVSPGALVVLVTPIDSEAPKGRMILPQVQAIRDLLDHDALCMVVKERELRIALDTLKRRPALVVTDSQAFRVVAANVPPDVPFTSFSILFARQKADLIECVRGTMAIESLKPGDRVLIAEACTHHPNDEDIGRVKIPRWLTQRVGGALRIDHSAGRELPADLADYRLVVQCGSCMLGRREVLGRMRRCADAGVPVTNYGLAIAHSLGVLDRALQPFPEALEVSRSKRRAD